MTTELPYAADAEVSLTYDELEVIEEPIQCLVTQQTQVLKRQYDKEQAQKHVTVQTIFNYAWGLVKSPRRQDQVQGVGLLQGNSFILQKLAS